MEDATLRFGRVDWASEKHAACVVDGWAHPGGARASGARKDLVASRVAAANQLRAHLDVVFPGAVGLVAEVDSLISLSFLERFPSAAKAAWLSEKRLAAWLTANAYSGRTSVTELLRRLRSAPAGRHGAAAEMHARVTLVLVPWADQLYRRHRAQHRTHPHTARILTRSWIDVIWRRWQDRSAYDPARHRALQRVLAMGA